MKNTIVCRTPAHVADAGKIRIGAGWGRAVPKIGTGKIRKPEK